MGVVFPGCGERILGSAVVPLATFLLRSGLCEAVSSVILFICTCTTYTYIPSTRARDFGTFYCELLFTQFTMHCGGDVVRAQAMQVAVAEVYVAETSADTAASTLVASQAVACSQPEVAQAAQPEPEAAQPEPEAAQPEPEVIDLTASAPKYYFIDLTGTTGDSDEDL